MAEIKRCPICKRSKTKAIQEQASQKAICEVRGCVFSKEIRDAIQAKKISQIIKKTPKPIHIIRKGSLNTSKKQVIIENRTEIKKDIFLTEGKKIRASITSYINNARINIMVAMAFFTDNQIAQALINSKNRGLDVSIIVSDSPQNKEIIELFQTQNCNIKIYPEVDNGTISGIMHHKFCIIDNQTLITGSYNYTNNAHRNNKENVIICHTAEAVNDAILSFNELFEQSIYPIGRKNTRSKQFIKIIKIK
jgi:phosphatidylserine/phosphatidylglycerophosphate/cardiolipin synthase-like enzyme